MTRVLFMLPLTYVAVAYLTAGWLFVDTQRTERICRRVGTPGRTTLLPIVAAVLWPLLALCYLAGLVCYGVYYGLIAARPRPSEW